MEIYEKFVWNKNDNFSFNPWTISIYTLYIHLSVIQSYYQWNTTLYLLYRGNQTDKMTLKKKFSKIIVGDVY